MLSEPVNIPNQCRRQDTSWTTVEVLSTPAPNAKPPSLYTAAPVLTAMPVGDGPAVPVVEQVTEAYAVVRTWPLAGRPVPAGLAVHLTATDASLGVSASVTG